MGKVLTVMNMKGGVGKTTVAMNIGGALGVYKWKDKPARKVLLIDYDPQFNLSQAYLSSKDYFPLEKDGRTVLSVLQEGAASLNPYKIQVPGSSQPPEVSYLAKSVYKGAGGAAIDIVPSTLNLMYIALGRAEAQVSVIEDRFERFIGQARDQYDLVVIDCHPAGSLLTKTALSNSQHVLIPVVPERYAVRGIGLMLDFMNSKKLGAHGPQPHILFNRVPRIGITREEIAIRSEKKFAQYCMNSTLKKYSAYADPEEGNGFLSGEALSLTAVRLKKI
ncbi:ParA family protein [Xanthomonas translucens]|uniref:ParA family protein n=1 Tax=Xanthomonas campestris pv. translucens TaxID=343 RepID=UPI001F229F2F|nr:ParA family protein [Xanthomonas translucens]UKE50526.1 ParA family protein [Xanthomonas translucens]